MNTVKSMTDKVVIVDPAFEELQPGWQGFYIWRVMVVSRPVQKAIFTFTFYFCWQKMELVPVPRDSYGKFFNGDAYIVYSCTPYGETGGVDTRVYSCTLLIQR